MLRENGAGASSAAVRSLKSLDLKALLFVCVKFCFQLE